MNRQLSRLITLFFIFACWGPLSHGAPNRPQPRASFATLSREATQARDANRLEDAISLYRRALILKPAWQDGWWSLGTILYDRDQYPDAARAFERLLNLNPRNGTARLMLGLSQYELNDDSNALKNIEAAKVQAIATDPQLRKVMLYHDGILLRRAGKFEGANQALEELCTRDPESEQVIKELGMAVLRVRDKAAPALGTLDAEIVQRLGQANCLVAQKKFEQGRSLCEVTAKQYPNYPNIHYAYGRLLLDVRDTAAAIEEFERGIQNDPQDVYSRLEIAAVKYRVDSAAGIPYAQEAVKLNPHLPFAHYLLGLLLLDTSDYAQAIPELEIAQPSFPKESKVYFALGTAYAHVGRQQDAARARATFTRLSQVQGDALSPRGDQQQGSGLSLQSRDGERDQQPPQ